MLVSSIYRNLDARAESKDEKIKARLPLKTKIRVTTLRTISWAILRAYALAFSFSFLVFQIHHHQSIKQPIQYNDMTFSLTKGPYHRIGCGNPTNVCV